MANGAVITAAAQQQSVSTLTPPRSKFFLGVSAFMLVGVFVGFSRTFYLRALLGTQDVVTGSGLPWHLHLHGAVMSAWFLLVLVQAVLIQRQRVVTHRRLGTLGAMLALVVVIVGVFTIVSSIPRANLAKSDPAVISRIVVDDMLEMVVTFPVLVGMGIWFRRKPDTHKRLMWLSCVTLWPPVLARYIATFAILGWPTWLVFAVTPFTWLIALVVHDVIKRRRLHPATVWGGLISVLPIVIGPALSRTDAGRAFVIWLGLQA
jgi:hypothetical protein